MIGCDGLLRLRSRPDADLVKKKAGTEVLSGHQGWGGLGGWPVRTHNPKAPVCACVC